MMTPEKLKNLYDIVKSIYVGHHDLLFHGWHHIEFVYDKAALFAESLNTDILLAQACALVHDLNYVAQKQTYSKVQEGATLRHEILLQAGFTSDQIGTIENIITEAATENRHADISLAAQALSDADTLFKALPTTPILFASRFLQQTGYSIEKLSQKVIDEQKPLMDQGIYFYSPLAKTEYMTWAKSKLALWEEVLVSLKDPHVVRMLAQAGIKI